MKKILIVVGILLVAMLYSLNISSGEISKEMVRSWIDENIGFEKNLGQVSDFEGNPVQNILFRAKLPEY